MCPPFPTPDDNSGLLTVRVRLELGLKTSDRGKIPDGRDGTPWPTSDQLAHLIDKKDISSLSSPVLGDKDVHSSDDPPGTPPTSKL
jgi:hypothetical protein